MLRFVLVTRSIVLITIRLTGAGQARSWPPTLRGEVTMTMHADQLVGAPVSDSDGLTVGTVEQVFRDDVDGTPSWARIRSAKGLHFVPLAGSTMTRSGGLCVPFDSRKILCEPRISVDRHMSVDQEEQLRQYYGIRVPSPRAPFGPPARRAAPAAETPAAEAPAAEAPAAEAPAGEGAVGEAPADETLVDQAQAEPDEPGNEWVVRSEERIAVTMETHESGRVRMRKYVDTEPVRRTVRVFHEELEIERVPIGDKDQVTADMAECEQEIVLHETRAKITKETVPVERVRLSVRKVEEDKTVSGEIRKERIEVVDDGPATGPPRP
jgi:uncharacterized protein (TIGR02271 family)